MIQGTVTYHNRVVVYFSVDVRNAWRRQCRFGTTLQQFSNNRKNPKGAHVAKAQLCCGKPYKVGGSVSPWLLWTVPLNRGIGEKSLERTYKQVDAWKHESAVSHLWRKQDLCQLVGSPASIVPDPFRGWIELYHIKSNSSDLLSRHHSDMNGYIIKCNTENQTMGQFCPNQCNCVGRMSFWISCESCTLGSISICL